MRTILYTTDYSQNSVAALRYAHTFAKTLKAQLIVMHVFDIPISLASPVSISYLKKEKKLFVGHRAKLEDFCEKHLGASLKELLPEIVVNEAASIINGIQEKAVQADADLIVVGAKGASKIKEFFLGSTTKGLLKKSPCPVMVVPSGYSSVHIKTMVYATDFERADVFAIRELVEIAAMFNARIRVVHITTIKEYAGDQQMEWFKEMVQQRVDYNELEFDLIFSDNIFEELQWYMEKSDVDLLAMLERKDSTFFERYFQRDLVQQMVSEITVPLLSFNKAGL
jgi:nucleotide-binding universal stress UspA family protein